MSKALYGLYFALGPVYWLPGIGPNTLQGLKLLLFAFLTWHVLTAWASGGRFPVSKTSVLFFLPFVTATLVSIAMHGGLDADVLVAVNILLPMCVMCIVPTLPKAARTAIFNGIKKSPVYFSMIAVFVPIGLIVPSLNWPNPYADASTAEFFIGQTYTGFGGSRTGWSLGASLMCAIALANFGYAESFRMKVSSFFIFAIISFSIFIPAGRGGIVAVAGMMLVLAALGGFNKATLVKSGVILLIFGILLTFAIIFADELRLDMLFAGQLAEGSTGRSEGYEIALRLLSREPVFGVGVQASDLTYFGLDYNEIHNVLLNFAARFGFFAFIPGLLIFGWLMALMYANRKRSYQSRVAMCSILAMTSIGIISFTEPVSAFGVFHCVIIYWFLMALFVGENSGKLRSSIEEQGIMRSSGVN